MFGKKKTLKSIENCSDNIKKLKKAIDNADSVLIGAGSGLSTAAGFIYTGERFEKYFYDFIDKYAFTDMYSGGFFPFSAQEEFWAYWSRYIYINRYMPTPKPVYEKLLDLVNNKDYFVLTTNVDHCFQKAGIDKKRMFYTQGDYGLFQCSEPCHQKTYDNEITVRKMVESQGFSIDNNGSLIKPEGVTLKMNVPTELIPHCPICGKPMSMNLRSDDTFVEDVGWDEAAKRYKTFLKSSKNGRILFLEIGVGYNTPGIIKFPFWQMTMDNPKAVYACVNYENSICPEEIRKQSILVEGEADKVIDELLGMNR
ncbi:MAG: Sir2 silent information regulator family NAD-dependent deacetylase [Firmicutes bacterium]|nr:Sir2 silent information regulator family NAD-dependent deacetylase [Bacillota bacterium]